MAAAINQAVGTQPDLVVGDRGEFTVWVDSQQVGHKTQTDEDIVKAVQNASR